MQANHTENKEEEEGSGKKSPQPGSLWSGMSPVMLTNRVYYNHKTNRTAKSMVTEEPCNSRLDAQMTRIQLMGRGVGDM